MLRKKLIWSTNKNAQNQNFLTTCPIFDLKVSLDRTHEDPGTEFQKL